MSDTTRGVLWSLGDASFETAAEKGFLPWPSGQFWSIPESKEQFRCNLPKRADMYIEAKQRLYTEYEYEDSFDPDEERKNYIHDCLSSRLRKHRQHRQFEKAITTTLRHLGLETAFREAFARTQPLWFGFWIQSSLNPTQCDLLYRLLHELWKPDHDEGKAAEFLSVLKQAATDNIPLYVEAQPPGHIDFGYYTVFWHCPRCKVDAIDWLDMGTITCPVCGHVYDPEHIVPPFVKTAGEEF